MGIIASDIDLIEKAMSIKKIETVISYGSQNLYLPGLDTAKPPFARGWFESRGMEYESIDLAGDDNSTKENLAFEDLNSDRDLLIDFGTHEHLAAVDGYQSVPFHEGHINSVYPISTPSDIEIQKGFYQGWKNKHQLVKVGGLIISVNPKTGYWPDHGFTYLDVDFYRKLSEKMGYTLHHLFYNTVQGNLLVWNVECILEKTDDRPFLSFEEFNKITVYRS